MNELIQIFQPIVNKAFLVTLLFITINNINREISLMLPLRIIRYFLIGFGVLSLIHFGYYLFFEKESEENHLFFLHRATESLNFPYIFMLVTSLLLPFILLIRRIGRNKWLVLAVSFFMFFGAGFEKFIIIYTSLYRGHMPASWVSFYPTWDELPVIILISLLAITPIFLLIFNIVVDIVQWKKKSSKFR